MIVVVFCVFTRSSSSSYVSKSMALGCTQHGALYVVVGVILGLHVDYVFKTINYLNFSTSVGVEF